ncbi:hypothetical protein EV426DRAFT_591368 [Tirmania nivea]|nr:hypothetical protein EV426DRAFT_591368 [Tirmania nivea]
MNILKVVMVLHLNYLTVLTLQTSSPLNIVPQQIPLSCVLVNFLSFPSPIDILWWWYTRWPLFSFVGSFQLCQGCFSTSIPTIQFTIFLFVFTQVLIHLPICSRDGLLLRIIS